MARILLSATVVAVGLFLAVVIVFVQSADHVPAPAVVATPASAMAIESAGPCPGSGGCYVNNGTPGCVNGECCSLVCAIDSFCCDTFWDGICAEYALTTCPTGDICSVPTPIGNGSFPVDLSNNTDSGVGISCGTPGVDEWFEYTATSCVAIAEICTEFTVVDITIAVFDACGGTEIACGADNTLGCPFVAGLNASAVWDTVAGSTYLIRVSGNGATTALNFNGSLVVSAGGSCFSPKITPGCDNAACCDTICAIDPYCCDVEWDSLCVEEALAFCVPGGECENAIPIGNGAFPVDLSDNNGLTGDDTVSCGVGDVIDEWYSFTATGCTATAEICTEFATLDITIAIFETCASTEIACGEDFPGCPFSADLNATVTWDTIPGQTYLIRLSGAPLPPAGAGSFSGTLFVSSTGGGTVASGDPFEANGSPYSWDCECTDIVCTIDPFCCDTTWDALCADEALEFCAPPCDGDVAFAGSPGSVGILDLLAVLSAWGATGPNVPADVFPPPFGDGVVGIQDLLFVLSNWGACP